MLPSLLRHLIWADRRTAEAIDGLTEPPSELLRIWAHLLAAESIWLGRIDGRPPDLPVWPTLSLADCHALMARNHDGFARLADAPGEELVREVEYRTSRGESFRSVVTDILHHVTMHGMYHRGQVALEVRRLGGEPRATDLIFYLREARHQ